MLRLLACGLTAILSITSCKKQQYSNCDLSPLYMHLPFHTGVAIDVNKLKANERYREIVTTQFNSVTPENAFKFDRIQPLPGEYNWELADYLVDYAKQTNKRIHGHTLLWFRSDPQWIESYTVDKADDVLREHISHLVSRYTTSVLSWDVVNEAFDEEGNLRKTAWYNHFGEDYIRKAFLYAQAANPDALLFYNDYNLESNPRKLDAVLKLLKKLRQEGVKIDGIGMQLHISHSYPGVQDIARAAGRIVYEGFTVHFSEMDISLNPRGSKQSFSSHDLQKQAQRYRDVFRIHGDIEAARRFGITVWGASDADSWITGEYNRADAPLLFNENYEPKPAYCACKSNK